MQREEGRTLIIESARAAAGRMFTAEFRGVFLKTIGMTLALLVGAWFGLQGLFDWLAMPWIDALLPGLPSWAGWLGTAAAILAGLVIAGFLAIPLLNLATPLFAAAMMVHLHKAISRKEPVRAG